MTDLNATWNEATRGPRMSEATGKVIFKYQMPVKEQFVMELPVDAQIIRMQDMDGFFWLWAVVDTDAPTEKRFFRAFKTGAKIPDDFDTSHYIGFCAVFVQMELGLYIFEDRQQYESERAHDFLVDVATKSSIVKKMGLPVVDIKLSEYDPEDFRGWPDFLENGRGERSFNWSKMMCQLVGFNIYNQPRGRMSQNRIDEIEAQGGFDEEEN